MSKTPRRPGRPAKPPTAVIRVPVDRVADVEKILGRPVAVDQSPHVMVRVPVSSVQKIRTAIKKG